MQKTTMSLLAAAALIGSTAMAFADNAMQPMAQQASAMQPAQAVCHHDGELVQTPNGLAVCHMRPVSGVHFKSRDWFGRIGARAAATNQ